MTHDFFVNSSICQVARTSFDRILAELEKVENPRWHIDDKGDVIIEEDFDMRHIEAIIRGRWQE